MSDKAKQQEDGTAVLPGVLTLVGTPIGNLGDLSQRAINALRDADLIAAEDTRRTQKLLNHLGIKQKLVSYHQHNMRRREEFLIKELLSGSFLVLVSDAGMPGISDPGVELVRACLKEDIVVSAIPGPSALIIALVISGLASERFAFEGFLPASGSERLDRLQEIRSEKRTILIYEAPHRLQKTLLDLKELGLGARYIALARELTKMYESVERTTVEQAFLNLKSREPRGEYVLVIEGAAEYSLRTASGKESANNLTKEDARTVAELLDGGHSVRDIVDILMASGRFSRNQVYDFVLNIIRQRGPEKM